MKGTTQMLNWLSERFTPRGRRGLRPAPHLAAVAQHNSAYWRPDSATLSYTNAYQVSSWVYVAVNRIAEAAALVPLHVLRVRGEGRVAVENHPLERLLDAPNPYLSRFELFEQTVGMLELTGNAYWFLAGDGGGVPTEIWTLRPDRVSIVPDAERHVRGYVYEIDGVRLPLLPEEVIHFKRWHPGNDYYGLSALEAARMAVDGDRAMAAWNRNTFGQDNGVPAGIVSIKEFISDADFERIKREWRSSYGGAQRRTAFLRGGGIEWQNIGLSHTDLDFLAGRAAQREEILNIFGVPVGLLSENATEANAKVAERLFIERTLYPKLVRIAQKITSDLLPFYPGAHIAQFDDIRPTDVAARIAEIQAAGAALSINEIREKFYQLAPVAWGDLPPARSGEREKAKGASEAPALSAQGDSLTAADAAAKAALDELAAWERFALKRLGKAGGRPFAVRCMPDDLAFAISAELLAAGADSGAVKAVFADARARLSAECAGE